MTPTEILLTLIRFNTTNPPGNEKECILWIQSLLRNAGFKTSLFSRDTERPNLVARLNGRGVSPPLLLYGHVDVVPALEKDWNHDPFDGVENDGHIWGRGVLDMKGGIAMMLASLLKIANEGFVPSGDIIFAALSDEEAGGDAGARFMVSEHPEQFQGIRYAIGEFGGFPLYIGKTCFYPIQTGEKQVCWMTAILHGPGGHASQRITGGAMATFGSLLTNLDKKRFPVHITPIAREMITAVASQLPLPAGLVMKQLLNPMLTDHILNLLGDKGQFFDPILHNTVNVTMVKGGSKINVIPSEITVKMDGRILPGYGSGDLVREIETLTGIKLPVEIILNDPCPPEPDMGLFDMLSGILKEAHPGSVPIPLLLPGITDARFFSTLGIQTYGFLPMNLPPDFDFTKLVHAANERIPEYCLEFGTSAITKAIRRYALP